MKLNVYMLLMLLPCLGIAQQVKRPTISAMGGTHSGGGLIVTYTAGETRVESSHPSFYVTEGFQQGNTSGTVNREEEIIAERRIKLFPNPVSNQLFLEIENDPGEDLNLEVFDAIGRNVSLPMQQRSNSNTARFTIEASSLSAGIYFLALRSSDGQIRKSLRFQKIN